MPKLIHCKNLPRIQLYKLLGMAKSSLAMNDEDYRVLLQRNGAVADASGHFSAKSMSSSALEKTLHELQAKGAVIRKPQSVAWRQKRLAKCMAIWHALADAGRIQDRSTDALDAFVANRVKGVTHLRWASSDDLNKTIEILKRYVNRSDAEVH